MIMSTNDKLTNHMLVNKFWTQFLPINTFKFQGSYPEKVTELKPSNLEDVIFNLKAELAEYLQHTRNSFCASHSLCCNRESFQYSVNSEQNLALEDYIEVSVQCNKRD